MSIEHVIMAIVGLAMAAYAVIKSALGGGRSRPRPTSTKPHKDIAEQAKAEAEAEVETIEEEKHEQVDEYTDGDPDGLADDAQSVIDGLRRDHEQR